MNNKNLVRNIKVLVIFFSLCFFGIIAYLTYFNLYVSGKIVNDITNPRLRIVENEVLRGSILDRNGDAIAYSKRDADGKQKRYYKYGEEFAHVTGYNSFVYGKTGIELAYNDILQGKSFNYDVFAHFFKSLMETINEKDKKGDDVYLTIDKNLQQKAYDMLGSDKGAAAAVNPKTGEILAMVSKPSFDPGAIDEKFKDYNSDREGTPFLNRAAQGYYPPGSTFKIITAASALENISNINSQTFNCTGKLKIGNYTLSDFNGESHGKINLENAFRESCNYTFGQIGIKLKFNKLEDTAERFMFNKEITVNDECDSIKMKEGSISIDDPESPALTAQDAIGQHGVTSNPLHMALVASSIANDGVMMKPYIVKEVRDRYGVAVYEAKPEKLTTAVNKNIANRIKDFMIKVVKSGTGTNARISGITVAGKTGTAEVEGKSETHSWFVAFAPAENPKIAVAVIVENGGVGGVRAAEIAREMIRTYLKK